MRFFFLRKANDFPSKNKRQNRKAKINSKNKRLSFEKQTLKPQNQNQFEKQTVFLRKASVKIEKSKSILTLFRHLIFFYGDFVGSKRVVAHNVTLCLVRFRKLGAFGSVRPR